MADILLGARVVLALVFLVAGIAKLIDPNGSRQAGRDFGLPETLVTPLGRLLPLLEITVATSLLFTVSAWWGAIAALVLLLIFTAGMARSLSRGQSPECHCFGQLHSGPISRKTILRNALLATVAGFVVAAGHNTPAADVPTVFGAMSPVGYTDVILSLLGVILIAGQWWFLVHVLRQNGRLMVRIDALEAKVAGGGAELMAAPVLPVPQLDLSLNTPAPDFRLPGLFGETSTLGNLLASRKPLMLLFTDPHCGPCSVLLSEVGMWQREYADLLTIAVISRGAVEENRKKAAEHRLTNVLLQQDREVAQAYHAYGTPSAVLVRQDGTLAGSVAPGADAIKELLARTLGGLSAPVIPLLAHAPTRLPRSNEDNGRVPAPAGTQVGEPAPAFQLRDLSGRRWSQADLTGSETLILFWNTGCGFCQQMLPDLKAWETSRPPDAPRLVVISSGPEDQIQAMDLHSPVLLDPTFSVGPLFGVHGTPMGILIDGDGRIASEVGAGAPGVWQLAGSPRAAIPA